MRNSEAGLSRRSVLAGVGVALAGGIAVTQAATQPASAATTTDLSATYGPDTGTVSCTSAAVGMCGDTIILSDGAISNGTATLSSASASFTTEDVGKSILVAGAGTSGAPLRTTVLASVDATHLTLAANASATVSGAKVTYGTNDTTAFTNGVIAAAAASKTFVLSAGKTYLIDPVTIGASNVTIRGYGATLLSTMWATDNTIGIQIYGDNLDVRGFTLAVANLYTTAAAGFNNYDILRIGGQTAGSVYHEGVVVADCTFSGAAGLMVYRSSDVVIDNNKYSFSHGNSFGAVNCRNNVIITGNNAFNGNDDLIAVTADSGTGQSTTRVVVSGNVLDNTDASCVKIAGGDRVTVSDNQCNNSYSAAISVLQDTVYSLQPSHRVIITGNTIQDGGYCYGDARIHATVGTAGSGIRVTSNAADCIVSNNLVLNSARNAIDCINGNAGMSILGNRIITAAGKGISLGDVADTTFGLLVDININDNMIRDTKGGIVVGSATGINISDNTIRSYSSGGGTGYRGIQYGYLKNGKIADNIIVNDDGGGAPVFDSAVGQSVNLRTYGNQQVASATQTDGLNVFTVGGVRIAFSTASPTSGNWAVGDRVFNSSPASGTAAGWTCTTAGVVNNTAWAATTAYLPGQLVYNGANVYLVTVAGTSAGSGGPTGGGSAIVDGTVKWAYQGAKAVFVPQGNDGTPPISARSADIQVFTTSGTWTKPAGAKTCDVLLIGAGGGGGAGARGPSGTALSGGGSGAGGAMTLVTGVSAAAFTATVAVTVPAGGSGAPGQTKDSSAGAAGRASTSTTFGAYFSANRGGAGGGGGLAASGAAGGQAAGMFIGSAGVAGSASGAAGTAGNSGGGAPSGGSGGGVRAIRTATAGGTGAVAPATLGTTAGTAGAVPGGAGGAGSASPANINMQGSSGGGGAGSTTGAGGAGGAGGRYGAGGGGGGASLNGHLSGAGGAGAAGICVVTTYF